MVSPINEAFMKFQKRAEAAEVETLVETFVDVEPLMTLLSSTDHQVIYGRRGTGKTHAFGYFSQQCRRGGEIAVSLDLRTIGSTNAIYNDPTLSIAERATRLIIDILEAIHDELLQAGIDTLAVEAIDQAGIALDRLGAAAGDVRISGSVEEEDKTSEENTQKGIASAGFSLSAKSVVSASASSTSGTKHISERVVRKSGEVRHRISFGASLDALEGIVTAFGGKRIWILLDEWSAVSLDLQPILADLLRRVFLPVKGIVVKIAAIEQRSRFRIVYSDRTYVGLELGADIAANINLDDFMVFDVQQERAREFFRTLLFKHYKAVTPGGIADVNSPARLIQAAFTQVTVFDEFVRASEGVPRDAINVIALAAQRALDNSIATTHLRVAARDWYQRDKGNTGNERARILLNWIVDKVIAHRKARAFLLRSGAAHPLIDDLFDARVLHLLQRTISSKDEPGIRYAVYKLDYGCYVDLINTQNAPGGLFELDEGGYVEVPPDDYRSIRRAILDLAEFERAHSEAT